MREEVKRFALHRLDCQISEVMGWTAQEKAEFETFTDDEKNFVGKLCHWHDPFMCNGKLVHFQYRNGKQITVPCD